MQNDIRPDFGKLEAFDFDAEYPFSARLARENGWSRRYTARVVVEYRRFLWLARTAEHPVTPSESIDQAWHLHILHTQEYRSFCSGILGRALEHIPSRRGSAEHERFVRNYEQTLSSYLRVFGEEAPPDIWPSSAERFGANRAQRLAVVLAPACLMLAGFAAVACSATAASGSTSGPEFLGYYLVLWLAAGAAAFVMRSRALDPTGKSTEIPALDAYEAAQLAGGAQVALDSAVISLIATGHVSSDDHGQELRALRTPAETAPAFERLMHREIAMCNTSLAVLRARATELTRPIAERLHTLGLIAETPEAAFWIALALPIVASLRLATRVGTDKPIGFLVLLTLAGFALAFGVFKPRPLRTRLGDTTLARVRAQHGTFDKPVPVSELANAGTLPLALAFFGPGLLDLTGFPAWGSELPRQAASVAGTSSCDAGGGDSGGAGDGGGGCGGCGGCGGGD